MSVSLATQYKPYVDELFKAESKSALITNTDYDWTGAHAVKIYKISTAEMNDYTRNVFELPEDETLAVSRYGNLFDLNAGTEEMILSKDRSFIFNVDKLDTDETQGQLNAASALARQLREAVVPEIDKYVIGKIVAGTPAENTETGTLDPTNIYAAILAGAEALDDAETPEAGRVLVISPAAYNMLKQSTKFDNTDVGAELRLNGVVGILDGMAVVKVPANRLPENVQFIVCHPAATVAPIKLEDYSIHSDTVLASGDVVTGRVCYDAFVLDNKANSLFVYYGEDESDS